MFWLGRGRVDFYLSPMPPLVCLLSYVTAVFVGGAFLAPWLYSTVQAMAESWPAMASLADYPFHRFVNRSLLILAVVGLWPFLRCIEIRSWRDAGLVRPDGHWGKLARGFALGFLSLAAVALLCLLGEARRLDLEHSATDYAGKLASALGSAAIVAVLEEVLFRGALFGALRRTHPWVTALLLSSAVYAVVHFFAKPEPPAEIEWYSGFGALGQMLEGFIDLERLVPGFLALVTAGMILGLAYQRTGNLYFSIGLHAGWIFWLKFYGFITHSQPAANLWFWGTRRLIDGWLALVVLAAVLALLWLAPKFAQEASRHAN